MSRFSKSAGGSGGGLKFIKPADLARAEFKGIVAEGEFLEALPNQFDDRKNDFKIKVDTLIKVKGVDKEGNSYEESVAEGDTVIVNGAGNLNYLMKKVAPGELCQIEYLGKNEIESGKHKGTLAHTFKLAYGAED